MFLKFTISFLVFFSNSLVFAQDDLVNLAEQRLASYSTRILDDFPKYYVKSKSKVKTSPDSKMELEFDLVHERFKDIDSDIDWLRWEKTLKDEPPELNGYPLFAVPFRNEKLITKKSTFVPKLGEEAEGNFRKVEQFSVFRGQEFVDPFNWSYLTSNYLGKNGCESRKLFIEEYLPLIYCSGANGTEEQLESFWKYKRPDAVGQIRIVFANEHPIVFEIVYFPQGEREKDNPDRKKGKSICQIATKWTMVGETAVPVAVESALREGGFSMSISTKIDWYLNEKIPAEVRSVLSRVHLDEK